MRSRESLSRCARAVPETLSDGSVVWNVELFDGSARVAVIGAMGGEQIARHLANTIDRVAAWISS